MRHEIIIDHAKATKDMKNLDEWEYKMAEFLGEEFRKSESEIE